MTDANANDMKPQDDPDKETRALQREEREKACGEMIEMMEFLYDALDSGKSFEELAIAFDLGAAGGAMPEALTEMLREALDFIREMRKEGADRNEVITLLRERAKADTTYE
jgi:hypothetical protein